jgi:RNA polymerase sigma-70 factor (ECF subfamily)
VRGSAPVPDADLAAQWKVVDAFMAAARDGDFDALVAVLDPDVVLRADGGVAGVSDEVHGAETVARQALTWSRVDLAVRPALINGAAGLVSTRDGQPFSIGAFTIKGGRIAEIDILADRERLAELDLTVLGD